MTTTPQPPGQRRKERTQFRATQYLVDFGDGLVAGRVHRNPDGSPGGVVADTAEAEATVWIDPEARVFGNARVFGQSHINDRAKVHDNARVDDATIGGDAEILGNATVDRAIVQGNAKVGETSRVGGGAVVTDAARVGGSAKVMGEALIDGNAVVGGTAWIAGGHVTGDARITDNTVVRAGEVHGA